MRAAITGGTGFVGAVILRRLLHEGFDVAALARDPSKIARADDVDIVEAPLENEEALGALARGADVFFHLAGLTHARRENDYFTVNVDGAARAARAAAAASAKFVHISSLSARSPEVSPYARSKYESEKAVADASGANPWIALRLPAIYGPGDRATLPFFRLVKSGLALEPKTDPPARASILYVDDAAEAVLQAAREAPGGGVYEVGDDRPEGYAWSEIGAILGETLGTRPRPLRAPRPLTAAYHGVSRALQLAAGRNPDLRAGQVNEFFHPDWVARENLLAAATAWRPTTTPKEGFAKTVLWYQENGLL